MKKIVFITGASRGIGRAIAEKYVLEGFSVFINARHADALERTAAELSARGPGSCVPLAGDAGDSKQVAAMFAQMERKAGTADILVNNAGISHIGLLSEMTDEEWERILRTNLSSAFYCCRAAIPGMVQKKTGKIVNISSVWGNAGASCEAAYSATKGGVNALTKALAKELAPSNIQVNAVACGAIDTDMNAFLSKEERAALIDEIPACRMGAPCEAADLVFALTEGPAYLTGQIINLDGGWM